MTFPLTAIISDLHGNWPALQVALKDAFARAVERVVCLGDVVGYGSKPRQCLDLVMKLIDPTCPESRGMQAGFCLQGNHEYALLTSAEDFNPNARAAIEWTRDEVGRGVERELSYIYWDFLAGLEPVHVEEGAMYAHGSPRDPVREYLLPRDSRDVAKMRANFECMKPHADRHAYVCFVGHSHVPGVFYEDGRFYRPKDSEGPYDLGDLAHLEHNHAIVNVGSVGQPRDGDARLSYVVFDGRNVTFLRLEYPVEETQAEIRAVPELPNYLADRLGVGQ